MDVYFSFASVPLQEVMVACNIRDENRNSTFAKSQ